MAHNSIAYKYDNGLANKMYLCVDPNLIEALKHKTMKSYKRSEGFLIAYYWTPNRHEATRTEAKYLLIISEALGLSKSYNSFTIEAVTEDDCPQPEELFFAYTMDRGTNKCRYLCIRNQDDQPLHPRDLHNGLAGISHYWSEDRSEASELPSSIFWDYRGLKSIPVLPFIVESVDTPLPEEVKPNSFLHMLKWIWKTYTGQA